MYYGNQSMVVFQYRKTTISISLRLQMAERCSWTTACLLWRNYDYRFFYKILYALAQEKWCVVGLAFVMNKTCAALNYVPVRVAISVWILFRDREKMTEILKATMKTMQISRIFIIILLLNEITYDFFSLCRINAFLSSVGCQSSLIHISWLNNSFLFHFKLTLFPNDMICYFKTSL